MFGPYLFERKEQKFFCYRIAGQPKKLELRNAAGSAEDLAKFIGGMTSEIYHPNKFITKYEITYRADKFTGYSYMTGARPKVAFLGDRKLIGKQDGDRRGKHVYYSFPEENELWDFRIVKSASAKRLGDKYEKKFDYELHRALMLDQESIDFLANAIKIILD